MTLPDFLVIGVPKAGTTALHAALQPHPGLFLSTPKEPKFFLTDGRPPRHGGPGDIQTYAEHVWRREDYERLFAAAPAGTLAGEASPFYLHDKDSHERLHRLVPQAKLIVVLRSPVDRAYSNWGHLWAAGLEKEADFVRAVLELEPRRREAGWAAFWHYAGLGLYGGQLESLYRHFPREQVLVMRYRDLRDTPGRALDRVCAFLGVETGVLTGVPGENISPFVPDTRVNAVLRALLRFGGRHGHLAPPWLRPVARGPLLTALHRTPGRRPTLTGEQRAAVLPLFVEDIALLERVTGEPYADWVTTEPVPVYEPNPS